MVTLPWLIQLVTVPEGGSPGSFQRFCGGQSGSGAGFCLNTAHKFIQVLRLLHAVNLCSKGVDNAM